MAQLIYRSISNGSALLPWLCLVSPRMDGKFHHFPHEMFIIGGKHHIVRPSISLVVKLCFHFPTLRKHLIWVENDPRWVTRPFPGWLNIFKHAHSPGIA